MNMQHYQPKLFLLSSDLLRANLLRAFSSTVPSNAAGTVCAEKFSYQDRVRPKWRQRILADLP